MLERLVLRYSGNDTIQQHLDTIVHERSVWWGWWTKDGQEPVHVDFLEWARNKAERDGLKIGLVDRKRSRYAVAACDRVMFDSGGLRIPAPEDGRQTPEYYRSDPCGAWFRLRSIDELSLVDYERNFLEVPVGDATLYVVGIDRDEHRQVLPKPNWDFSLRETNGNAVLHISDLHFGVFHGYPVDRSAPGTGVDGATLADRLIEVIEQSGESIGVVFVSGDLVSRGEEVRSTLESFSALADRLRKRFGIEREQFVIVPGNHDFLTVTDYKTMKMDYKHELEFKQFMRDFYSRSSITDVEQPFRFLLQNGVEIAGIALNSARLRDEGSRDYGFVARHRYERMLQLLSRAIQSSPESANPRASFALLHHHLVPISPLEPPIEGRHISVTADAGEIVSDLTASGIQVAVHGHQHLPFAGSIRASRPKDAIWNLDSLTKELFILGGGSAGVRRSSLPDEFPFNSAAMYTFSPDARRLSARLWRFLPRIDPEVAATWELELSSPAFGLAAT